MACSLSQKHASKLPAVAHSHVDQLKLTKKASKIKGTKDLRTKQGAPAEPCHPMITSHPTHTWDMEGPFHILEVPIDIWWHLYRVGNWEDLCNTAYKHPPKANPLGLRQKSSKSWFLCLATLRFCRFAWLNLGTKLIINSLVALMVPCFRPTAYTPFLTFFHLLAHRNRWLVFSEHQNREASRFGEWRKVNAEALSDQQWPTNTSVESLLNFRFCSHAEV